MGKKLDFHFSIPRPPEGPVVELSAEEMERLLLRKLEDEKSNPTQAMWELAQFYKRAKQHEKALGWLRTLMSRLPDAEDKARCVLAMGQAMEKVKDFPAAVRYYKEALALEPVETSTWYFINNNLGYSLNKLGHFREAENYCRKAIAVDRGRPNAFKNLGLALKEQGEFQEAARCFVKATQVNAADARSLHLLEELLRERPDLQYEFEGDVECCKEAVKLAAQRAAELKPVVCRGWRKHLILWQARVRSLGRKLLKLLCRF